jgi:chromosome partitioning protein
VDSLPASAWLTHDVQDVRNTVVKVIRKGGPGKTSVTLLLADALARLGLNALVIDTDPQGNASMTLRSKVHLVPEGTDRFGKQLMAPDRFTVVDVIENGEPGVVDDAVQIVDWGHDPTASFTRGGPLAERLGVVGVLPCYEAIEGTAKGWTPADLNRLRRTLHTPATPEGIAPNRRWDVVLIDTPPGGTDIGRMAIKAADWALLITTAESYGMEAIAQTLRFLDDIRDNYGHADLRTAGLVLSYYDPRRRQTRNQMEDFAQAQSAGHAVSAVDLWPTRIPHRTVIPEAQDLRAPVSALLADSGYRDAATVVCQVAESIALRLLGSIGHPLAEDLLSQWQTAWPQPMTPFVSDGANR